MSSYTLPAAGMADRWSLMVTTGEGFAAYACTYLALSGLAATGETGCVQEKREMYTCVC